MDAKKGPGPAMGPGPFDLARPGGLEPPTYGLEDRCYYPAELRARIRLGCCGRFFLIIIHEDAGNGGGLTTCPSHGDCQVIAVFVVSFE